MKLIRYTREVTSPEQLRGVPGEQRELPDYLATQVVMDGYAVVISDIAEPEPPAPPSMEPIEEPNGPV